MQTKLLVGLVVSTMLLLAISIYFTNQDRMESQIMKTGKNSDKSSIRYELETGTLNIDSNVLEEIKLAMLTFFSQSNDEFPAEYLEGRKFFKQELKNSAVWIDDTTAEIGVWDLENQNGELYLVRHPTPETDENHTYFTKLEFKNSRWKVISLTHERELGFEK